jgi:UDP-glucose 4-epimerase
VYNLAGSGTVSWDDMARIAGKPIVRLPSTALHALVSLTWRLRLQGDSPSAGVSFVEHPWIASMDKARTELGFVPRYTSRQAWQAFVDGRKSDSRRKRN